MKIKIDRSIATHVKKFRLRATAWGGPIHTDKHLEVTICPLTGGFTIGGGQSEFEGTIDLNCEPDNCDLVTFIAYTITDVYQGCGKTANPPYTIEHIGSSSTYV